MHNPTLIPVLMKDSSIPKGMIYRELKKALPVRIGIEFELAGNFSEGFVADHPEFLGQPVDTTMAKYYKVYKINSDYVSNDPEQIKEIRVSIIDFRQLAGLYNFMQDLSKYCRMHEGGGIHIHVDMTEFNFKLNPRRKLVKGYITKRLDEIGKIFPKYKGKYNKKRVGDVEKATWVNMSRLGTLEFRTAPLTFDYNILMVWLVALMKFRRTLVHDCRLKTVMPRSPGLPEAPRETGEDGVAELVQTINQVRGQIDQLQAMSTDPTPFEADVRSDEDVPEEGQSLVVGNPQPIDTSASYTTYITNLNDSGTSIGTTNNATSWTVVNRYG